jgi:hypothetical protein
MPEKDIEKITEKKPESVEEETPDINWTLISLRILVFNIFVCGFIFALYKLWPLLKKKLIPSPIKEVTHG